MKTRLIIDESREEEVIVVLHQQSNIFEDIKRFVDGKESNIIGYKDTEIVILKEEDICCFFTEGNKVYANTIKDVYLIKKRLYQLEKELGLDFIKINQGCIANLKNVTRFNASFTGTLEVNFKNGYKDYVSRRELKKLKERIGVKWKDM